MLYTDANDVDNRKIERHTTSLKHIDELYGGGLPKSAISVWGGEPGIGKTRLCVSLFMAALLAHKTLYFQLETALSQFKAIYFSNTIIPKGSLLLSTEKDLQKQCDIIKSTSPHLIVVDSVNKIDQFENGRGADVIETKYREAIGENGPHVIFLTHLNAQGQLKGGTSLPHMGDIVALIKWSKKIKSGIEMTLSKTRYGTTDIKITMIHTHLGIENAEDAIDKMLEEDL